MAGWTLAAEFSALAADFGSLDAVFALQGERITHDPLSEVIRVERAGVRYYVKRYWGAGKGLRRYLGRPRVKAEWQNLKLFAKWGIATAPIVAYGLEALHDDPRLADRQWVATVSLQLAQATRILHDRHFTHNDLKWRNLLVNAQAQLFFIDCPSGSFWWGPLLSYRIVKDLACLDKVAKLQLSRTQRLRFYLQYCRRERLSGADKQRVGKILGFFEGRQ